MPMKLLYYMPKPDDPNKRTVKAAWRPQGHHLAITNGESIRITDRYGENYAEFLSTGKTMFLDWHKDGDLIAGVGTTVPQVVVFRMSTKQPQDIDLRLANKETPTFAIWSPTSQVLVVGTDRGNVIYVNMLTSRKTPVLGKHQRAIIGGLFNSNGLLALASDDATITISNDTGDTINSIGCNSDPEQLTFIPIIDEDGNFQDEYFIGAILVQKTLMLCKMQGDDTPINLQFQEKYGKIVRCTWFESSNILMAFESGNIICLHVTQSPENSSELFSIKDFENTLCDMAINVATRQMITLGDCTIKIRHIDRIMELAQLVTVEDDTLGFDNVSANNQGNLIFITGKSGGLMVFLTKVPVLGASYRDRFACMSGSNEVTIMRDAAITTFTVDNKIEPSLLAISDHYFAMASNNQAWFYDASTKNVASVREQQYFATISKIKLNNTYAMVLLDGRIQVHVVVMPENATLDVNAEKVVITLPIETPSVQYSSVVDAELTERYCVYTTESMYICFFSLLDWTHLLEFKHPTIVRRIFPEMNGVKAVFVDDKHDTHILDASTMQLLAISDNSNQYSECFWESFTIDRNTFVLINAQNVAVFISNKTNNGMTIKKIGDSEIPSGTMPMMLSKGIVYSMTQTGKLNTIILESQKTGGSLDTLTPPQLWKLFETQLTLKRWRNAWKIAEHAEDHKYWNKLAEAALLEHRFEVAGRVYKRLGNIAMVFTVGELLDEEDHELVNGMIHTLMGRYDEAEQAYMSCGRGDLALNMRRDVLHWEKALDLARSIKPTEIPLISKEYANQLEFLGHFDKALDFYERAIRHVTEDEHDPDVIEHNEFCQSGVARMSIKVGDISRGVGVAENLPGRTIKRDCGLLLEELKQYNEAGKLYEIGAFYDRAVAAYLKARNFTKFKMLGDKIRSPKLLAQYGKILENEKRHADALKVYLRANNHEAAVRVMLNKLDMVSDAVKLVRGSRSTEGAKLIAKHFNKIGETSTAVEFLVLSKCYQEAFQLAEAEDIMEVFANAVELAGAEQQYEPLAKYYTTKKRNPLMAGKFLSLSGDYYVALETLMALRESEEALLLAVDCAVKAKDDNLVKKFIDYLLGESDGIPKDPRYLFRLYANLHRYVEASKTAIILAQDEQSKGNYKMARDLLFEMQRQLLEHDLPVPAAMTDSLGLLHSYLLVKSVVKRGDDRLAARLLIRVAEHIGQFSAHMVDILTSTVILCTKAGLNASAFKYAVQLLRPELRSKITEKYRRKIETIVRRSAKDADDVEEPKTPCPFCEQSVEETTLSCVHCRNRLPMCIITGRHVVADDFAVCPTCASPGYFSEFKKLAGKNEKCPLCCSNVGEITPTNMTVYLQTKFTNNKNTSGATS